MFNAIDIANYFLSLGSEEAGDLISNLKLQKLLYYAQGFHLALFGTSLFNDEIEAWAHGPVVASVYRKYKRHGAQGIPVSIDVDFSQYTEETKKLLDEVYSVYGQFSAWKLRDMTHNEPPWKDAYKTPNSVIGQDSMSRYFSTRIKK